MVTYVVKNIFRKDNYLSIDSIDATDDDGSLGRLVNDSLFPNAKMKLIVTYNEPHLCLFAERDINKGEEILYRYGVDNLPWYEKVTLSYTFVFIENL